MGTAWRSHEADYHLAAETRPVKDMAIPEPRSSGSRLSCRMHLALEMQLDETQTGRCGPEKSPSRSKSIDLKSDSRFEQP